MALGTTVKGSFSMYVPRPIKGMADRASEQLLDIEAAAIVVVRKNRREERSIQPRKGKPRISRSLSSLVAQDRGR